MKLLEDSAIIPEIYSDVCTTITKLNEIPAEFNDQKGLVARNLPALLFRVPTIEGATVPIIRPDEPKDFEGKYLLPSGTSAVFNFKNVENPKQILFVEGVKQSMSASSYAEGDTQVYGLNGCWGFSKEGACRSDIKALESINSCECIYLCFDADVGTNANVWLAAKRFQSVLKTLCDAEIKFLQIPEGSKIGLDDFLASNPKINRHNVLLRLMFQASTKLGNKPKTAKKVEPLVHTETTPDNQLKNEIAQKIALRLEDSATELCAQHLLKHNHIYTTQNDLKAEMWIYCDGIYVPHGRSLLSEQIRNVLGELYTPQRKNKILAKIEADTGIDEKKFFENNYLEEIPVKNGILNLKTKKLKAFTPQKIFFNKLPVSYNESNECKAIDSFLDSVLAHSEDKVAIYQLLGYCLWKNHFVEKAFMFNGEGRNGKGKLISIFKHFLGAENCCSVPLAELHTTSSGVCELHAKLANLAGDLNNTSLKETGLFKSVVGRDLISAKRKFLTDITFQNYSKQIFACNELPRVYDTSYGFWARWVLFDFPYTFVSEQEYEAAQNKENLKIRDERIIEKLITPEEMSGLLNKALEGLHYILDHGDFSITQGVEQLKTSWQRKADSFTAFCSEHLEENIDGFIAKSELRKEYLLFVKKHRLQKTGENAIKKILCNQFGSEDSRQYIDGKQQRVWIGISFINKIENSTKIRQVSQERHPFSKGLGTYSSSTFEKPRLSCLSCLDFLKRLRKNIGTSVEIPLKQLSSNGCDVEKLQQDGEIIIPYFSQRLNTEVTRFAQ